MTTIEDKKIGIVYKIVHGSDDTITDCYVGSTVCLKGRKSQHKRTCNDPELKGHNLRVYQFIREHGGWDAWKIEILSASVFTDNTSLRREEFQAKSTLNASLNTIDPPRASRTCPCGKQGRPCKQCFPDAHKEGLVKARANHITHRETKNERTRISEAQRREDPEYLAKYRERQRLWHQAYYHKKCAENPDFKEQRNAKEREKRAKK